MQTEPRFFSVEAVGPWGDYGRLLAHGFTQDWPSEKGAYAIARTGPHVPIITKPHGLVVTEQGRDALITSGLQNVEFRDVIIGKIAYSDWHNWDRTCDWPEQLSHAGEPEALILDGMPLNEIETPIPKLYEVRLLSRIPISLVRHGPAELDEIYRPLVALVSLKDWGGADIFVGLPDGADTFAADREVICTEGGKSLLESIDVGFLEFRPCIDPNLRTSPFKLFNPD